MRHLSDYSAEGIPIRLFLVLLLSFSWCFAEVMALDKDQQFDSCRTRQGYPVSFKLEIEWTGIWKNRLTEFNNQFKISKKA